MLAGELPRANALSFTQTEVNVAAVFFNVVTVGFRMLYVFIVMEIGTRKMLHSKVTTHLTSEWRLPRFREAIPWDHDVRFVT